MNKEYFGSKFYNSKTNTILLFVLIILMIIALRFMYKNKENCLFEGYKLSQLDKSESEAYVKYQQNLKNQILGNKDDLVAFSVAPNTKINGLVSFRGIVRGGYFFEGNILINILDENKNTLKNSNAKAKTDWMTDQNVEFEGSLDFTSLTKGPAYIEIHNDNASGLKENDKSILIPIIIE